MEKYQVDINLTVLKEVVAELWSDPELKSKFFKEFENKDGKTQTILRAELPLFGEKVVLKGDETPVQSDTAVLNRIGHIQTSINKDGEWDNKKVADVTVWRDKDGVDQENNYEARESKSEDDYTSDGEINVEDIPFN